MNSNQPTAASSKEEGPPTASKRLQSAARATAIVVALVSLPVLALVLLLVGCSTPTIEIRAPSGAVCALTCVEPGNAATAGHCANSLEPIVFAPTDWCGATARRAAVQGESVTVRGFAFGSASERASRVVDPNWLGWVLVDGRGQPGESGGGIYGADGALLGIVVETHDRMTWARKL